MRAALFGKLPAQGDFVSRGLSPSEQASWDRLLSEGVAEASRRLGSGFEAAHEAAAPWRFRLPAGGALSTEGAVGVVAASVDRVGRRFLLAVLVHGADVGSERETLTAGDLAEGRAFAAFTDRLDADALLAALGRDLAEVWTHEPLSSASLATEEGWWPCGADAPVFGPADAPRAIAALFQGAAA